MESLKISYRSNFAFLHLHKINVFDEQQKIKLRDKAKVENILEIPKADSPISHEDINRELENNVREF